MCSDQAYTGIGLESISMSGRRLRELPSEIDGRRPSCSNGSAVELSPLGAPFSMSQFLPEAALLRLCDAGECSASNFASAITFALLGLRISQGSGLSQKAYLSFS